MVGKLQSQLHAKIVWNTFYAIPVRYGCEIKFHGQLLCLSLARSDTAVHPDVEPLDKDVQKPKHNKLQKKNHIPSESETGIHIYIYNYRI